MRLAPRIPRDVPRKVREPDYRKAPNHLAFVRKLPCLACNRPPPNAAHHALGLDLGRGMARKAADRWTTPLCDRCHMTLHDRNHNLLADLGIDERAVARALWKASGDLDEGQRIVWRARNTGRRA